MLRRMIGAVVGFGICVGTLSAFEFQAVLQKIDAEQKVVIVAAGGQDRTVKLAKDAKFLDEKGRELPNGIKDKSLKGGVEVTLTVERAGNDPVIRAIQLGKKAGSSPTQGTGRTSVGFKPLTGDDGPGQVPGGRRRPLRRRRERA